MRNILIILLLMACNESSDLSRLDDLERRIEILEAKKDTVIIENNYYDSIIERTFERFDSVVYREDQLVEQIEGSKLFIKLYGDDPTKFVWGEIELGNSDTIPVCILDYKYNNFYFQDTTGLIEYLCKCW